MPTKKRPKRTRRLLKRADIARREKARKLEARKPKMKFGKRSVGALPLHIIPMPTKKRPKPPLYYVERDTETPNLCIRVTPTTKTFFWQKTINRVQKRVTIGRYPEINVKQARAIADDIAGDYSQGTDVQERRAAARNEMTLGELWLDYRENRPRKIEGQYSPSVISLRPAEQCRCSSVGRAGVL